MDPIDESLTILEMVFDGVSSNSEITPELAEHTIRQIRETVSKIEHEVKTRNRDERLIIGETLDQLRYLLNTAETDGVRKMLDDYFDESELITH